MGRTYLQPGDRIVADNVVLRWDGDGVELDPDCGLTNATSPVVIVTDAAGLPLELPLYEDEHGLYYEADEPAPVPEKKDRFESFQ